MDQKKCNELWQKFLLKIKKFDTNVILPPPNVTGSLHLGHALNIAIQDLQVRFSALNNYYINWIPGTDHAGIATQMLVKKSIGEKADNLSREELIEEIWQWKKKSESRICTQIKTMGALLNWEQYTFSLNENVTHAVRKVFCDLYQNKLIEKDKRMIYWDTKLQTAISNLEVQFKQIDGHFYHIKYFVTSKIPTKKDIKDSDKFFETSITVATTRPETIFGDEAIAVHPADKRYQHLIGCYAKIPLTNKWILIIADERCDPKKGTGAVKVTPAHDFLDFEIGKIHNLPQTVVILKNGTLAHNNLVPKSIQGLTIVEARKQLCNLIDMHIENLNHLVPYGDRSGTILEPYVTSQWFVNVEKLAPKALRVVRENNLSIIPEYWIKTYEHWLENIEPWCISRQICWGHKIPAYYTANGSIFVAEDEDSLEKQLAQTKYKRKDLREETDVLDTWFSSALWPLVTTGWPNQKTQINDFLVTGSDILFFWVTRMILMSMYCNDQIPFKTVYLHGLVQDEKGKKMSKSKNNVIDPMTILEKENADILRFALLYNSVPGKNARFSTKDIDTSRRFHIKIQNMINWTKLQNIWTKQHNIKYKHFWNIWIFNEITKLSQKVKNQINKWQTHEASQTVYFFTWNTFCSWYIEGAKHLLKNEDTKLETMHTIRVVISHLLHVLHPFLPFITEQYWQELYQNNEYEKSILKSKWPNLTQIQISDEKLHTTREIVKQIRSWSSIFNIDRNKTVKFMKFNELNENEEYDDVMLASQMLNLNFERGHADFLCLPLTILELIVYLPIKNITKEKIKEKLQTIIDVKSKTLIMLNKRLQDDQFVENADFKIIQETKESASELQDTIDMTSKMIQNLENKK